MNGITHSSAQPDSVSETVLAILRTGLWGEARFPFTPLPEADWEAVYTELCHHAVQQLPVDALVKADPAHRQKYLQHTFQRVSKWYQLMKEQQAVFELLRHAGIPCAVIKGAAADIYYPQPLNRAMGDVDLVVKPEDFDRAHQLLRGGAEYIGENYRHIEFRKNGTVIELHRAFGTFRDETRNALIDGWIFGAIDRAEIGSIENHIFPMLPKKENGLVLLTHINVHLENGLGLRQIIDWMMFADRELSDDCWHTEFAPWVRQLGLETLAVTVTRMCQIYLGLREDITWCKAAEADLCGDLMAHILSQGNFGRKLPKGFNRTVNTLNTAKNLPALFRALQRRGCINWSAIQKRPWLKPFAWIYQIFRYIRRGIQLEHPLRHIRNAFAKEHQQDTLLDRLGVSRMKEEH